jgi:arsenate reductase (glutaredoxin)
MITIYHNPKCRKSRAGLQYLIDKGLDINVVEYLKKGIPRKELKDILMKLNLRPHDIIRTTEDVYNKNFKGKNFTDEEWIDIMLENPKLIQRPIVVRDYKAVIGRPVEEIDRLF